MSLDISTTQFEIRSDVDGALVLNQATKLIPVVQTINVENYDVAFPNPTLGSGELRDSSGDYYLQVWGLTIVEGEQSGYIVLGYITPGTAPNLIVANIKASRLSGPAEDIFGPFIMAIPTGAYIPIRSGMRVEYTSFIRRIVWLAVAGGELRLYWKQSSMNYYPVQYNFSDPNYPEGYLYVKRPPGYTISANQSSSGYIARPFTDADLNTLINFRSTWRFSVMAKLLQV